MFHFLTFYLLNFLICFYFSIFILNMLALLLVWSYPGAYQVIYFPYYFVSFWNPSQNETPFHSYSPSFYYFLSLVYHYSFSPSITPSASFLPTTINPSLLNCLSLVPIPTTVFLLLNFPLLVWLTLEFLELRYSFFLTKASLHFLVLLYACLFGGLLLSLQYRDFHNLVLI